MRKLQAVLVIILVLAVPCTPGFVAAPPGTPPETAAQAKDEDRLPIHKQDQWQFFVSPYLWIPGVNLTTTSLRGSQSVNVPWWDVASVLFSDTIGVMGRAEAWRGRWGVYLDSYFMYVGLSDSKVDAKNRSFGPVDFTLSKQANLGGATIRLNIPGQASGTVTLIPSGSAKYILRLVSTDIGGRFLVGAWPMEADKPLPVCSLEVLGGLRFNSINQYLRINLSNIRIGNANVDVRRFSLSANRVTIKNGSYTIDYNLQFFEPFIGLRVGFWLTPKVVLSLKGDVGGFGLVVNNNVSCNLEALLGYRFHKNVYAYAGYKARGIWNDLGDDLAQVKLSGWLHGPVLGVTYTF